MRRWLVALASALAALVGCARFDRDPAAGRLEVRWTGSDSGAFAAPAEARWCAERRRLELRAIRGDTGVGLAVFPKDSLAPGSYRVVQPTRFDTTPPRAGVAVRWFGRIAIRGFQGISGTVALDSASRGLVSGRVDTRARSVTDTTKLNVAGTFRGVPVRPAPPGCGDSAAAVSRDSAARDTAAPASAARDRARRRPAARRPAARDTGVD